MAVPSDNSNDLPFSSLSNHTGEGVVIDIGTGDGRFVSAAARDNPNKFYIGIDPNVQPLEKPSMKATRKPVKGGLPNALFIQASVEDLPGELDGVADEIHIHFPWGSLLRAVATGDISVLSGLRRIGAPDCMLEIVISIDPERDKTELRRLELPQISEEYIIRDLMPRYVYAGFRVVDFGSLDPSEWRQLDSSWARKLQSGAGRTAFYMVLQRVPENAD